LCDAASIFGAGQAGILADRPEQRRIRLDVEVKCLAIDRKIRHRASPV
jgi:hypothetical protein